jgi:hypothetical protein
MSIEDMLPDLLRAELKAIDEFIKEESRQGRQLSHNEAAMLWIEKYAVQFRRDFEAKWKEERSG